MNLLGTKILAEAESPINGKIKVVKSFGLGTYIQVANLTQSGGVVYGVWKSTLQKITHYPARSAKLRLLTINHCLILGLGGGSAAVLVKKFWPEASITGVDIDPVMVELGQKFLNLPDINIVIGDAEKYFSKQKYNLILIDLYLGDKVPEQFESDKFINKIKKLLDESGAAVFNRLYYGEKRPEAMHFARKLETFFTKVDYFFPEANLMLVCSR